MSTYPPSILERAGASDGDPHALYMDILTTARDTIYQRALDEGAPGVSIVWADEALAEQRPWMPENERITMAFTVLTYGVGTQLWGNRFTRNGVEVPMSEIRGLLDACLDLQREVIVEWPLVSREGSST
jgi:hypothetical protein